MISAGEENKNHSSLMKFTEYLNYTPGEVPCQQVVGQDKTDSMFLIVWFGLGFLLGLSYCFYFVSLIFTFYRETERKRGYEGESIGWWIRGKALREVGIGGEGNDPNVLDSMER